MVQENHTTAGNEYEIEPQTIRRLGVIQKETESCDDTITRLLDDAIEEVPIETILTDLLDRFDNVGGICVDETSWQKYHGMLTITVFTAEEPIESSVSLYEGQETRALIESKDGNQFSLQYDIVTSPYGPKYEMIGTTPVYAPESNQDSDGITIDEGVDRLRTKIDMSSSERRELLHGE